MLDYVLRMRDLVHGTILFTREEMLVINHPFFQRLRHIRQNDVAFYVYPSMNTSRFEHTLGVCRVAGMMAETLTKSPKWGDYFKELKRETGIKSKKDFVKLCRFYALLHDIGHFPLSHLFEYSMESWSGSVANYKRAVEEWTGVKGFEKLHEGLGAVIAKKVVQDVEITGGLDNALFRLMTEKDFLPTDPLFVAKSVVDSDIDADRIDFTQRDGLLAGGEYGHYDTRRLCDSVFIEQDGIGWLIAYSEKALTSMEALLLDRYRIYEWVHFHHRVIAVKMLVMFLVGKTLETKLIAKEHFNHQNVEEFALKDDIWLWNILRSVQTEDKYTKLVQGAVFYRQKENILNLWKTRPYYHALQEEVAEKARQNLPLDFDKTISYQRHLSSVGNMDMPALIFEVKFDPVGKKAIYLYSEAEGKLTGKSLLDVSKLVSGLKEIWNDEPQYFVLLVEDNVKRRAKQLTEKWVKLTVDWILNPRLW
ncbi:MAG: HD domain-containing protein [Patescibacteria group bacterium]